MNAPTPTEAMAVSAQQQQADRYAIILAGGSGTRLWPLSRASMPKQLLALNGEDSLLQQTARRLLPLVSAKNVVTVTHADHRFEVIGQLHAVNDALATNVLAEPIGRNTLPAIAWAVARIAADSPQALIGVFSSDHAVADEAEFHRAWRAAELAANDGYIALFGMQPTEPATGYGYIQAGEKLSKNADARAQRVNQFVEKPDRAKAENLLQQGGYFWNAGMFVFRADVFLQLLQSEQPSLCVAVQELATVSAAPKEVYQTLPDLSIDYGLLEKYPQRAAVVSASIGWSDLGSWEAIYQQREKDADGNTSHGPVLAIDSSNSLLWSEHGLLATLGIDNLAIVQTRDATLVAPREKVAELKQLVAAVKQRDSRLTETHLTVARPWGSYTVLEEGPRYKIKRIEVHPGQKLSMQMHYHRSEHWVVIAGTAKITNGDQEIYLEENESTYIPKTHRHRLENPGRIPLQIIEIQTGAYLEEDDIVRFGDVYGRS